jgi:hemolysin activation/secretion protein
VRGAFQWAFALLTLLGVSVCACAQQSGPKFEIHRFEVTGNTLLSAEDVGRAVAPFIGTNKDFSDIRGAAEALEGSFRERGYGVVQVSVPQQEVAGGVVRLQVVEPRVGKVTVEGNSNFDTANIRASLPAVKEGATPNTDHVARNLQLANENPSKQTTLLLRAGASEDVVDVGVRVVDEKPWKATVTLDNTGTSSTGYYRSGFGYQHTNLFGRDHTLTAQYITSPTYASRVSIYGFGYKIPFYEQNGSLELILGYSDVNSGTVQGLFSVAGAGAIGAARWNWILPRWGETEQKVSFGIDYRAFSNQVLFQGQNVVPDITIHPVSATYTGVRRSADGELSFYGGLSVNVPGGNDGTQADFTRSRAPATDRYSILRYGLNYMRQLGADWQMRAGFNGQHTRDALVSGEQWGVGGSDTVRGYGVREVASDRGYAVQLELYTPELAPRLGLSDTQRLRLLAFIDGGSVWRNHALPAEQLHDSIGSIGVGARWNYGKSASLRLDLAQVLQATANRRENSQRVGAALSVSF